MTRNNQHQQGEEEQQLHKMFSSDAELLRDLAKTQSSRAQSPREKRVGLIAAMGHFRPKNATPIQFYNYVREFCIMHNCSIDEAMERAPDSWTKLSKDQRRLYNSVSAISSSFCFTSAVPIYDAAIVLPSPNCTLSNSFDLNGERSESIQWLLLVAHSQPLALSTQKWASGELGP